MADDPEDQTDAAVLMPGSGPTAPGGRAVPLYFGKIGAGASAQDLINDNFRNEVKDVTTRR